MKTLVFTSFLACVLPLAAQEQGAAPIETNRPPLVETNKPADSAVGTNSAVSPTALTNEPAVREPALISPAEAPDSLVTNAPSTTGYDLRSFRLIVERNIFNPNRSPRRDYSRRDQERESRPIRTESFGLLGTMTYEKGRFAFFDGSSSDYRRVVEPAQTIAGYTVTAVLPTGVTLQATNGEQVQLAVGMRMRRQEEQPWRLSTERSFERSSYSSSSSSSSTSNSSTAPSASAAAETTSNTTASAASSGGDAESEVLKRLLQKREQELNK